MIKSIINTVASEDNGREYLVTGSTRSVTDLPIMDPHADHRARFESRSLRMTTAARAELVEEGLIERRSFDKIPPRVEYSLTPRGRELEERLRPLWSGRPRSSPVAWESRSFSPKSPPNLSV